jgi:serine/threonine protein kinase/Flp pilus assembly protein TadD
MLAPSITVGQLVGHYRIVEKIGGGGQGEVFRAHDERFDRDVALKILPIKALSDDAARKRFRQEAQAVGKLSHPNIATAFYFGEENGIDFLVTEYISGARLDEKLAHGPLPEPMLLELGMELASGLEAAHREGIIHRDLKPGNLRVTENGQLKILDFGLAELVDPKIDVAAAETVSLAMTLTGTLPYMAPEQFEGVFDQRTDLWAVGVVLYELATGKLPFPETQLQRLRNAIKNNEPQRPTEINPAISQGLESVILRALEKDPKRRYQTAKEVRDDLARVAAGRDVRRDTWLRRHGLQLAVVALLIAVSAYVTHRFWPRPTPPGGANGYSVLAVLPIEAEGQNASENALVRGVAETVSARIAQGTNSHTLQLIPPNELSAQGAKTAEAARKAFGVDRVLAVALQRSGDKMRVTCSLINPKTHQQMDARTVTGDANDLFALEDNAVADVFAMLPQDARSEQAPPAEVHASEPAAYEYYVRGRGYLLDYQKPENIDSAIKQFEQALKLSPNYAPAYAGLGEAYWQGYKADRGTQWLDKAKINCEKALSAEPKLADGHTCLGNLYNDTGKYEDAVKEFQGALALDHDSVDALGGLGLAYEKLNDSSGAEATYNKAMAQHPQYWAVYNWTGNFYYSHARYAEAAAMFQKVIDLTPDNQRGYNNLGAIYVMEGRYQDAVTPLRKATDLAPSRDTYGNLGAAYFYLRQYQKAVDSFELAIRQDDKDAATWGYLGDALYWSPGRRPDAQKAYQKGVELAKANILVNPKDAKQYALLGEFSVMLDQKQTALDSIQKALSLAPKDPEVMFKAALVYNHLGENKQTLGWLEKATGAGYPRIVVRDTPDFEALKQDPQFRTLTTGT